MSQPKSLNLCQKSPWIAEGAALAALGEALEAVLAAEAGHGFAVAADRLRSLAAQAKAARDAIDPTGTFAGGGFMGARALPQ
ncbi:MAG: hypothetical protein IT563_09900 [Alphaproteobacteria bacterium]|nr:hypothetical protein [Alphaproteobacteria bacterium]